MLTLISSVLAIFCVYGIFTFKKSVTSGSFATASSCVNAVVMSVAMVAQITSP